MKTFTFILMAFLMTSHPLFGQITNDPLKSKEVAPMVPEATSILKYGDIPVSTYTGVPDISIPLYTVTSGLLSLPISLSYHASGITVNQESTWVGLGWDIIAGGSITYVPVGGNDQITNSSSSVSWADRSKLLNSLPYQTPAPGGTFEDQELEWGCFSKNSSPENYKIQQLALELGISDKAELDVYAVNIPGYSFKFIIHPQTKLPVFVGNKNKCRILYETSKRNFTIIGEDGTKYWFMSKEWNRTNDAIDRWFLTSIVSPEGNWINFKYKSYGTLTMLPSFNDIYFFNLPFGKRRSVGDEISKPTYYLEEIETPKEIVKFCPDNVRRIDIGGTGAIKLSKITVQNKINSAIVKDYNFSYDYFTGCSIGGDFTSDDDFFSSTIANDRLSKRLKLLQLSSNDHSGNIIEKHNFEYNEALSMPYKTSFARDFWGFYNGQENSSSLMPNNAKHTLLPNPSELDLESLPLVTFYDGTVGKYPAAYSDLGGANRFASEVYAGSWLLKSITYPTGGKSVFEFESNKIGNYKYYSADNFKSTNLSIWDFNNVASIKEQSFTLTENTTVKVKSHFNLCNGATYSSMKDAVVQIIGPAGPHATAKNIQLSDADQAEFNSKGIKVFSNSFDLSPGLYRFVCSAPDVIGSSYIHIVGGDLSFNYIIRDNNYIGAGMRVKKIINKDADGSIKTVKNYKYITDAGLSSGQLFTPVRCFERKNYKYCNGSWTWNEYGFHLSSDNYIYPASAYVGGDMGYDRVEVETLSTSDNLTNNGKEITYFKNDVAFLFTNIPIFDANTNGAILNKILLNRNSDTLRVENFLYQNSDLNAEQLNYKVEDLWLGPVDECTTNVVPYNRWSYVGRFSILIYPNKNFHSFLKSKETIDYFNGTKVKSLTNFGYNLNNYAANQITELMSNNKTKTTNIKFPHDYSIDPYIRMIDLNMISPEIERSEYIDGTFTQSVKTNYRQWSNTINNTYFAYDYVVAPESVSTKTGTNAEITRLRYLNYDLAGNILSAAKEKDVITSYLWAFNNSYPVVKATNIDDVVLRNAIISIAGATDLETFFSGFNNIANDAAQQTAWKNFNTALRSNASLANSQVTTYTYKPLVGMTSQTDPNGITTYYEYDEFGRLKNVKDKDQNILKSNQYHYYNN